MELALLVYLFLQKRVGRFRAVGEFLFPFPCLFRFLAPFCHFVPIFNWSRLAYSFRSGRFPKDQHLPEKLLIDSLFSFCFGLHWFPSDNLKRLENR